jgi:hypothetical protein
LEYIYFVKIGQPKLSEGKSQRTGQRDGMRSSHGLKISGRKRV